jgi:RNA polymerase sigma factor (sigma-70 family)
MSQEAFIGTLYVAYGASVRQKLRRAGVKGSDVDDLCQRVFVVALSKQHRLPRDLGAARRWILAAARKAAANFHRLIYNTYEVQDENAIQGAVEEPADTEARLALQDSMRQAARRLDPAARDILSQHHLDGESLADIGELLGLTKCGAHARVRQAEERLRANLREQDCPRSVTTFGRPMRCRKGAAT